MRLMTGILLALFAMLQYDLWVGEGSMSAAWRLEASVKEQQQVNNRLKERNAGLSAEVADLKQGTDAIEERARSDLGMVKKDETFIQVVE
ncbi:MAG: cell division protein FtsB [Gammaproteobacteria bacterium]|nr:cell division protein FtsB [Gammaproteobacteria bacterium]MDH5652842.1 cell division protein FtsB [Gammaproteobacteria bacterium]